MVYLAVVDQSKIGLFFASKVRVTILRQIRTKPLTGSVLAKFFGQKKYVTVGHGALGEKQNL